MSHDGKLPGPTRRRVIAVTAAAIGGLVSSTFTQAGAGEVSGEVGGSFAFFGGYISGRHLELLPGERIVQAWRAASWPDGDYSIVSFELAEQGTDTKIIFDHKGFPDGQAQHLARGWHENYWEPLKTLLAQPE
jgi:activator of HSP90 ATPase